jgi:hypothetical protein
MGSSAAPERRAAVGPLTERQHDLWAGLFEFAERTSAPWTLIGGLMTSVVVAEHAGPAGPVARTTKDVDIVADIRARQTALTVAVDTLGAIGFTLLEDGLSRDLGFRFTRGDVVFDLLAPDNTGRRTSVRTMGRAETLEAPGTTYALGRSSHVLVDTGRRVGHIMCPDLAGALVAKCSAAMRDRRPDRHLMDVALLLAVCPEGAGLREQLRPMNVRRLRSIAPDLDRMWPALDPRHADAARDRLRSLIE